jgi:hypothetical protein
MRYATINIATFMLILIMCLVNQPAGGLAQIVQNPVLENPENKPFEQIIDQFELKNETIFDAIAKLQEKVNIAVSFEMPLVYSKTYQDTPHPKYTGKIVGKKTEFILNWLTENVDTRFIWMRVGGMANFIAKSSLATQDYLFNAKLQNLELKDESNAIDALLHAIEIIKRTRPDTKVFLPIIGAQKFGSKWNVSFRNVTFRQIVDAIAQQLGPTWGWESGAVDDYYRIQFFERYVYSPPS